MLRYLTFIYAVHSKWKYRLFIVVFTLLSFEILLRVFKINQVWSESVGHGYQSGYNQSLPNWFYSWGPNKEFDLDQKDFIAHYKTNQFGIREREVFYTDSDAKKILCLGDSYTEGVGAPYDSSYPKLLQSSLNNTGFNTQVYNAGIAGSDPFYAYQLFKEKLFVANPRYVFITFNSSDLTDFVYRGGLERFKPDGTVQCRTGPWYEPLYHYSYLFRLIINDILKKATRNLFLSRNEFETISCPQAVTQAASVFDSLNRLGHRNNFELMVILQPICDEMVFSCHENDFTRSMFKALQDSLNLRGIKNLDMWKALDGKITIVNKDIISYPNDKHFTPNGYLLFTNTLLSAIDEKYPGYWK